MNLPNGWLSGKQASYLTQLVRSVADLVGFFLEIGSWQGRSSVAIGTEVKKLSSHLYCIDIWNKKMTGKEEIERRKIVEGYKKMPDVADKYFKGNSYHIFNENIKANALGNTVIPIVGLSATIRKAWKAPLRFIFVDGSHEYKYVRSDSLWRRFLVVGGIIAFHDYKKMIKRAVNKEMDDDSNFETIGGIQRIKAFRRLR